ncbi:MAG: NADH-quinone oxidoreductase subunit H [Actinobacteria bacterium]|nr:NADH-quinone oxidoreductase subunit H [Actinomycetota bacterium]
MSSQDLRALVGLAIALVGGAILSPLLPGLIQTLKARLQGRVGPSIFQPYRELRRLWGKSVVSPQSTTILYRLAPSVSAAALLCAVAVVPVMAGEGSFPLGHDALVLLGLLALSRFALAVASWDTGSGFSLMSASRDLTFSVFVEALILIDITLAALPVHSTDLSAMVAGTAGISGWGGPVRWCALGAFFLVVVAETGRQPVDNPDTHLELTMIHEGPLLEYAGRDLAMLQWSSAARHWVILALAAEIFLPHAAGPLESLVCLVIWLVVLCAGLALAETWQAKMRLLMVPRLLVVGSVLAVTGVVTFYMGARL